MLSSPWSEANGWHRCQLREEPPAAVELCLWAVVDDVRHRLPLSALTQVGQCQAPMVEAGKEGTVACREPVQKGPRLCPQTIWDAEI